MLNIAKIRKMNEKSRVTAQLSCIVPMQGYLSSIVDRAERVSVKHNICEAMGIHSDMSFWRFVVGRTHRPSYAQREAAAEVVRHHSGNNAYTGEDLFPEHLYTKTN
jgi:hypothetical protein